MTDIWTKKVTDNLSDYGPSYDEVEVLQELGGDYTQFRDVETGSVASLRAKHKRMESMGPGGHLTTWNDVADWLEEER